MEIEKLVFLGLGKRNKRCQWKYIFFLSMLVCFLYGCAGPTKEKWLKVFFDGVPDSQQVDQVSLKLDNSIVSVPSDEQQQNLVKVEPPIFRHPPYAENACDSCHESKFSNKLAVEPPELCFMCHDDFLTGKKFQHYPAQEGMCTACHSPHKSGNKFMLLKPLPDLCFDCHDEVDILKKEIHVEVKGEICTNCHTPHAE